MKKVKRIAAITDVRLGVEATYVSYVGHDGDTWFAITRRGETWELDHPETDHFNDTDAALLRWMQIVDDYNADVIGSDRTKMRPCKWVFKVFKEFEAHVIHDTYMLATMSSQVPQGKGEDCRIWDTIHTYTATQESEFVRLIPGRCVPGGILVAPSPGTNIVDSDDMDSVLMETWSDIVDGYWAILDKVARKGK